MVKKLVKNPLKSYKYIHHRYDCKIQPILIFTFYKTIRTRAIYCNLKGDKLITHIMLLAIMYSYQTGNVCTLKCLYFCSLLNLFALTAKPLDRSCFKASTPSSKASSICQTGKIREEKTLKR